MNRTQTAFSEDKRLDALSAYQFSGTSPQKELDGITRLVSYICQAPLALITFIDADKQWVKSSVGIDLKQISRADAFCNHAINGTQVLEIGDLRLHPGLSNNPFVVQEPHIRFYAGAPLIDPDGYRLGALCVMDLVPRKLTEEQLQALRTLADNVVSHLVLTRKRKELKEIRRREKDLQNLVNTSAAIHCVMDRDFRIEMINAAAADILGYTAAQANGHVFWNLFSEGITVSARQMIKRGFEKHQKSFEIKTPVLSTSRDIKWLGWQLNFKEGKWYASGTDITSQRKAETDLDILSFAARKSPSGIIIRNGKGQIIWINEAQEKLIGYTLDEMLGKAYDNLLIGAETDMDVYNTALTAVKYNQPYEIELQVYRKDGSPVWVHISNTPLLDETGNIERQVGVMVDISERKKTEEQNNMLSLVASSTTSGVVINDRSGKVEWVNNAFESITGYTITDAKGKRLGDVLKGELTDVSVIQKSRELSRAKQSFEVDLLVHRKDGKPLWISVINSVILDKNGNIDKYIEVIIDITAKKKAEIELIAAREEALQLSKAKDMFISVMSHEIRTPLNAVIGMSHLLLDNNSEEIHRENLGILKFSAENLMTLINNVLDFTKIETGNIELERTTIELHELVQSITSSMQFNASEKKIYIRNNVDSAIPQTIIGDRTRLCQILLNLVGNAVKFTETGGVTIDAQVIGQADNYVKIRFAITDTGIGIANDKINTIFESFKQAESDTSRKYGGTGLGLAITKKLIELHGANIHVDSVLGKGSTFWFTLKFDKEHLDTTNPINTVETGLQITVLVVDDNQINRLLINKVLTKWGASIEFAENGEEAIEKLETNHQIDVVLMDIHMPVMGGIEATQIIRSKEDAFYQQLPIIALTASMLNSEINEIENSGMNDYILKPFDPKGLYDKLTKYQKVS